MRDRSSSKSDQLIAAVADPTIPNEEVRQHLSSVLQSKSFLASRKCSSFLTYIVDRALANDTAHLKEGAIAQSVFGRTTVVEGMDDSVVRVCAREVRKRLDRYYSEEGAADTVCIQLPVGTYVPRFEKNVERPAIIPELTEAPSEPAPSSARRITSAYVVSAVLLLCGALSAGGLYFLREGRRFREFWAPINNQSSPVLVSVGAQMVWGLSRRVNDDYFRKNPSLIDGVHGPFQFPAGTVIPAEDLVPLTGDRFTSGDMEAAIRIVRLMDRSGKACEFRLGNGISEEEARKQPVILVGGFSNPWTIEWNRNLRFYFHREMTAAGTNLSIRDRKDSRNNWTVPYLARDHLTEDYAIVSRVVDPLTKNVVILIAGLNHYGTQAAAELVTDQNALDAALAKTPAGWQNGNFEAVIHTSVINRIPNNTRIVTLAVW